MSHARRSPPPRAEVEPLEVDDVRVVVVGTALWAVAFLALLPFYGRLNRAGHGWWLWTCLAGVGIGLYGVGYCRRRRDAIARDRARARAERVAPPMEPLT